MSMTVAERLSRPHYVYRMFDVDMRLLYVGSTCDLKRRMYEHRKWSPWFHEVAAQSVSKYDNAAEALLAEREQHVAEVGRDVLNPHTSHRWAQRVLGGTA